MGFARKFSIVLLVFFISFCASSKLQAQGIVRDYINMSGLFSRLHSGSIESPYSPWAYEGDPYYGNQSYTTGSILFNNVGYTDQWIRLDLYKQQVVILSPANQAIIIPSKRVQKINIYDRTFIWVTPAKDCGLKNEGFYIFCFDGEKIDLLCEERVFILNEKATPLVFERKIRYYLGINGKYHSVNNRGDFLKLFPLAKKQIKNYARDNKIDFISAKEQSMIALAAFCDKL